MQSSSSARTLERTRRSIVAAEDTETPPTLQRTRHHPHPFVSSGKDDVTRDALMTPVRTYGALATSRSMRHVNLHAYDPHARRGFVEVKIGGHPLDYKRMLDQENEKKSTKGPLKTISMGATSQTSTIAYQRRQREELVYACVKIGGHPLDHVPFINRGLPSRPLLGFVRTEPTPRLTFPLPPPPPMHASSPRSSVVSVNRPIGNLYDCSRCLRLRQSPRLQLCCGHRICASCVASRSLQHMEASDGRCVAVECIRCQDFVLIDAIVFAPDRIIRMESSVASQDSSGHNNNRSTNWMQQYGGIAVGAAALSISAGTLGPRLAQRAREAVWSNIQTKSTTTTTTTTSVGKTTTSTSTTIETTTLLINSKVNGAERWQKRLQALKPPSKLLKYEFVTTLGVGNFAEVVLVKNRKGQLRVLKESDKLQEAMNEIQILSKIQSPHVVRIFQYFIEEIGHRQCAYIEMEYCDRGDLMKLLAKGSVASASFESIFRQLCLGLQEIHQHGIIHRDLKPGNVLLTSEGIAKIADFGVSTLLESDLLTHHAAGTLAFMAPEVRRYFLGEAVSYDSKADIWSLGALAVAMLTGNPEPRVAIRPLAEVVDSLVERGVASKYVQLIQAMLQTNPTLRPSLDELVKQFPPMNARL